jgi:hypothetical protein
MAVKKMEQQLGGIQVGYAGGVIKQINVGAGVFAGGVCVVTAPWVDANTMIWAQRGTVAGTSGGTIAVTRIAGTSFTLTSQTAGLLTTQAADVSPVYWFAVEV